MPAVQSRPGPRGGLSLDGREPGLEAGIHLSRGPGGDLQLGGSRSRRPDHERHRTGCTRATPLGFAPAALTSSQPHSGRITRMRQIKFALRTLLKTPVVTGIAILSLALGIGANAAVFTF